MNNIKDLVEKTKTTNPCESLHYTSEILNIPLEKLTTDSLLCATFGISKEEARTVASILFAIKLNEDGENALCDFAEDFEQADYERLKNQPLEVTMAIGSALCFDSYDGEKEQSLVVEALELKGVKIPELD